MLEQPHHQFCLMSFNILYGGTHLGQPLDQTAAVIRLAQADIVVVCEQWGNAERLADLLKFTCQVQNYFLIDMMENKNNLLNVLLQQVLEKHMRFHFMFYVKVQLL